MQKAVVTLLLAVGLLFLVRPSVGQDPMPTDTIVRVEMLDGTAYTGYIVQESDSTIQLRSLAGVSVTIPRSQVRRITQEEGVIRDGRLMRLDPNRTRLLFAPTARPLGNGRGYIADYYVFFPMVGYGVGDILSLAGGISLIPASSTQIVYFAPKITVYQAERLDLGAGVLFGTATDSDGSYGGLVYGIGTFGSQTRAVTAGVGFAFSNQEFSTAPALVGGGELQLNNSLKLITENYVLIGEDGGILFSGGLRFFGDRLSADLGFWTFPELLQESDGGWPLIPLVSVTYSFGR